MVQIEGRTFPVKVHYLEDALRWVQSCSETSALGKPAAPRSISMNVDKVQSEGRVSECTGGEIPSINNPSTLFCKQKGCPTGIKNPLLYYEYHPNEQPPGQLWYYGQ